MIQLLYLSPPWMSAAQYSSYSPLATSTIEEPLPPAVTDETPNMTGIATETSSGAQMAHMRSSFTARM